MRHTITMFELNPIFEVEAKFNTREGTVSTRKKETEAGTVVLANILKNGGVMNFREHQRQMEGFGTLELNHQGQTVNIEINVRRYQRICDLLSTNGVGPQVVPGYCGKRNRC